MSEGADEKRMLFRYVDGCRVQDEAPPMPDGIPCEQTEELVELLREDGPTERPRR